MRRIPVTVCLGFALTFLVAEQAQVRGRGLQAGQSAAMTNGDVIRLVQAGLGDAVIIQTIIKSPRTEFDTSSDALIQLKMSGVSDGVIEAVLSRSAPPPATPSGSTTTGPAIAPVRAGPADRLIVRTISGGILDNIKLYVEKPPTMRLSVRPFSATDADIVNGEKKDVTKTMQADGPRILAERLVAKLKELGPYSDVSVLDSGVAPSADAIVIEGKFTEIDPGSRAKRYLVGFGSGKSGTRVEGSVRTSDGTLLATFDQRRIGVMGLGGGDSLGKLVSDTKSIGEDLAKFLNAWATGKSLK